MSVLTGRSLLQNCCLNSHEHMNHEEHEGHEEMTSSGIFARQLLVEKVSFLVSPVAFYNVLVLRVLRGETLFYA